MKKPILIAWMVALLPIAAISQTSSSHGNLFLKCPIDGVPSARGYDLMLNRQEMKLSMMLPGFAPADFQITETDSEYRVINELKGEVIFKMILNKFTLKLMVFDSLAEAFGGKSVNTAQCIVLDKKI